MSDEKIGTHAMVLAAGFGTRMRPLTDTMPKPLIKVGGKAIIDYGMAHLATANVRHAVVNVHYLADQLRHWAETIDHPQITISDETDAILDTGGGIRRALPLLGDEPFFVLNSDSFWLDRGAPTLQRLRDSWKGDDMDCLLLVCEPARTTGYDGSGDFIRADDGRLRRKDKDAKDALVYIGAYLVHPRLFENSPEGSFSMMPLWEKAIAAGRLFGITHQGHWLHVGTPDAIAKAEAVLANYKA